ncbi:hypothetical protein EV702DRAFT_976237 [Suillus placidus]|uniref:MYND-type domain-containing protein n=1 Tax=Suillus placidus TaxID=48579 RepID=A0A9P6ZMX4_9AGAM|nr:hypothetical protein EV702DRAFT_976237 [Suillus placidus]
MATNPQKSLKSAVELLTSTMGDPMKANVCAIRLGIAADRIDQALEACTSIAEKTKIAKSYPELLRTGIKFLTFKQSPPDHVAMMNRLMTCHCDFGQKGMRNLHKPPRYRIDGRVQVAAAILVFDAVTTVSNCLILALADLTQHKFRSGNANAREQPWPQGPEDLLPPGPKDSLVGLEHWVAAAPLGYIVFKLAGHLAKFYVPFAREVFQSPHFTIALARPVEHLKEAVKFYDEDDSSPLARTHFFTYPVVAILEFLENLLDCDTPQFNIMITARGRWISLILARLTTIMSTLPREWSKTRTFVQYLTAFANAELDPVTGVAMIKFERKLMTELPHFDELENAFNVMVDTRKMGCWNTTCSLALDTIHSRLCSKCNLIRFCGKKASCQKEAWNCATLPHKSVCAKIHSLKEALGADDWLLMWTPDYTYAQFQVTCRVKRVDTDIVVRIGNTISALRCQKSAFLDDSTRAGASQIDRLIRTEQEKSAIQKLEDLKDSLGDRATTLRREHAFSLMSRDAYHSASRYDFI